MGVWIKFKEWCDWCKSVNVIAVIASAITLLVAAGLAAAIYPQVNFLDAFRLIVLLTIPLLVIETWKRIFKWADEKEASALRHSLLDDFSGDPQA